MSPTFATYGYTSSYGYGQDLNHHLWGWRVRYVAATLSPGIPATVIRCHPCGFSRSRSDQIGTQANPPSPCGWSVVNGFTSETPDPCICLQLLTRRRYDPTIGIRLSLCRAIHSLLTRIRRGCLLRNPHCRWSPLLPLHHRYRRPGGVPGALDSLDTAIRCIPPGLRHDQSRQPRDPRFLPRHDSHGGRAARRG